MQILKTLLTNLHSRIRICDHSGNPYFYGIGRWVGITSLTQGGLDCVQTNIFSYIKFQNQKAQLFIATRIQGWAEEWSLGCVNPAS